METETKMETETLKQELRYFIEKKGYKFFSIITDIQIKSLHDLYLNNNELAIDDDNDDNDGNYLFYVGIYYNLFNKNIDKMLKYYLMAVEKGNDKAMFNLGGFYQKENNREEMFKYYYMAIEKGNMYPILNLGYYYISNIYSKITFWFS